MGVGGFLGGVVVYQTGEEGEREGEGYFVLVIEVVRR